MVLIKDSETQKCFMYSQLIARIRTLYSTNIMSSRKEQAYMRLGRSDAGSAQANRLEWWRTLEDTSSIIKNLKDYGLHLLTPVTPFKREWIILHLAATTILNQTDSMLQTMDTAVQRSSNSNTLILFPLSHYI